jgi:hypothetical protein
MTRWREGGQLDAMRCSWNIASIACSPSSSKQVYQLLVPNKRWPVGVSEAAEKLA